jgi:hypothetical protein
MRLNLQKLKFDARNSYETSFSEQITHNKVENNFRLLNSFITLRR